MPPDFRYSSDTNEQWLSLELTDLLRNLPPHADGPDGAQTAQAGGGRA